MTTPQSPHALFSVSFHQTNLYIIQHNGEPYLPMRPIVEGMGLDWPTQSVRLRDPKYRGLNIPIPLSGDPKPTLCIPLLKLNGWLFSIHPARVREEIRERIVQYQEECFVTLYDHWSKETTSPPPHTPAKNVPPHKVDSSASPQYPIVALEVADAIAAILILHISSDFKIINKDDLREGIITGIGTLANEMSPFFEMPSTAVPRKENRFSFYIPYAEKKFIHVYTKTGNASKAFKAAFTSEGVPPGAIRYRAARFKAGLIDEGRLPKENFTLTPEMESLFILAYQKTRNARKAYKEAICSTGNPSTIRSKASRLERRLLAEGKIKGDSSN